MSLTRFLTPVALCWFLIGCGRTPASQVSDAGSSKPQVIDVIAKDYAFQLADTIPSGWTTFRFRNDVGARCAERGQPYRPRRRYGSRGDMCHVGHVVPRQHRVSIRPLVYSSP